MKSLTISAPDAVFDLAVEAICGQYGYRAKILLPPNAEGNRVEGENPESKLDFAKRHMLTHLREVIAAHWGTQMDQALNQKRTEGQTQLDAMAEQVTAEVTNEPAQATRTNDAGKTKEQTTRRPGNPAGAAGRGQRQRRRS